MITLNAIELPDLLWADEFGWSPVRQSTELSLTGALLVEEAAAQAGRPITLTEGWASYSLVQQLQTLANQAGQTHTLSLHGQTYSVMFRHADGGLSAEPLFAELEPGPDSQYRLTLRFMVV